MLPSMQDIDAFARQRGYRTWADGMLTVAVIVLVGVYARIADTMALRRLEVALSAEAPKRGELSINSGVVALPCLENGTPVLEKIDKESALDYTDPPQNDLQRRIARIRATLSNAVEGRKIDNLIYIPLTDAARMVEGEARWYAERQEGAIITDAALTCFTANVSRVSVNEQHQQMPSPLRLLHGKPFMPLKALVTLYGAELEDDTKTGIVWLRIRDSVFTVLVPERLFLIEISRSGRWLKVFYAGQLAKEYPICSGAGNNTPVGHFHIQNKAVWPSWRAYWGELIPGGSPRNPLGARWLGTTAHGRVTGWAIGIHGTNQPSSIGQRISGGCIRTYNHFSIELYDTIPIGTRVWIHE
ncbi:MAG: L,D-transpeptidase [Candidatus Zipacnadales bacterium]